MEGGVGGVRRTAAPGQVLLLEAADCPMCRMQPLAGGGGGGGGGREGGTDDSEVALSCGYRLHGACLWPCLAGQANSDHHRDPGPGPEDAGSDFRVKLSPGHRLERP